MNLQRLTRALCLLTVSLILADCGSQAGPEGGSAIAPTIATQPANQTVTAGQTATFSVTAAGTSPLTYQWQKGAAPINGATSASYITPATATSDSGSTFNVVVSNSAGQVTSNTAALTVNAAPVAPSITQQPSNQTVTAGQTATFSVTAAGTASLTYQWQKGTTATVSYTHLDVYKRQVLSIIGRPRANPAAALTALQATVPPIELGLITFVVNISCLYPTYVRGEAYLAAEQGSACLLYTSRCV